MQVIPDLGNIFSMEQTSYPCFQFQGAWLHLALLPGAVLDGWSENVFSPSH